MSSTSEKDQEPTQKKIRDAREKEGQVAQSKDLTMFMAIITIVIYFWCTSSRLMVKINDSYSLVFAYIKSSLLSMSNIISTSGSILSIGVQLIIIPIILAAITSLLVNLIQIGGIIFTPKSIAIKFDKFNVVNNFKQLFSSKNLLKFIKDCFQITAMVIVAFYIVVGKMKDLIYAVNSGFAATSTLIVYLITKILLVLLAMYLFFALIDYLIQKRNLRKQLMMTKEEIKQEYKNTEGNQEIKGRRKELHRELTESDEMENGVMDATLVLANPTHIAVVIVYKPSQYQLPFVLFKAKGFYAQLTFQFAKKHGVLIVHDKYLARKLYKEVEIGKELSNSLIKYVAEIIGKNIHLLPKVQKDLYQIQIQNQMNDPFSAVPALKYK